MHTGNYFVTLRCNDACEFDAVWSNEEYQRMAERSYDLALLKRAGVRWLNILGGEPLLRADLPEILGRAKALGLATTVTTNGLLYKERARELAGLIGRLYFYLDYPVADEHDRSRGVECFTETLAALKLARELGERPVIQFTLTRDSVRFLPEMVELSEKLGIPVRLSPVHDFYGTQGFASATIDHIRYFARRRNVLVNLAVLEFTRAGGNRTLYPRCHAKETTVTVLPDGRRVEPCLYNQGGKQGREDICSSCMRWPYMVPSFQVGLDKYYWLNLYAEWAEKRKTTN